MRRHRLGVVRAVSAPPGKAAPRVEPVSEMCDLQRQPRPSASVLVSRDPLPRREYSSTTLFIYFFFHFGTVFKIISRVWSKSGNAE